jgi:hypothetical protein
MACDTYGEDIKASPSNDAGTSTSDAGDAGSAADGAIEDASTDSADAAPTVSSAYRAAVLADEPIAYWRFGEAAGSKNAASETGRYPLTSGTVTPAFGGQGIFGDLSRSIALAGADGTFLGSSEVPFFSGMLTVELWLFLESAPDGVTRYLAHHATGTASYGMYSRDGAAVGVEAQTGIGKLFVQTPTLTTKQWHHIVAAGTPSSLGLWVDGVLAGTSAAAAATTDPAAPFAIGAKGPNQKSLLAGTRLAEVAVYEKTLDAARVTEHYALGTAKP